MSNLTNKFTALLFFLFAGVCFWILIQLLYLFWGFSLLEWFRGLPYVYDIFHHFFVQVREGTPMGIFYLFAFTSLFFFPVPLEVLFVNYLRQVPFEKVLVFATAGILAGQIINYSVGRLFSFCVNNKEDIKKRLDRHGMLAIIGVHAIPFPFQVFNLGLGALKYRFFRWMLFVTLGVLVKHVGIGIIYGMVA